MSFRSRNVGEQSNSNDGENIIIGPGVIEVASASVELKMKDLK